VWLFHPNGMHARPAIKLTKIARRFASSVRVAVSEDGPWTDAKSIARVLAMKTPSQVTLFFEAEGADAHDAVRALTGLVASDFLGADGDEQPSGEQPAAAQPT
jgi:phosphocarrier protein